MKKYIIFGTSEWLSDIFDIIHWNNGKVYKIYQNMSEVKRERSIGFKERVALLGYDVTVYDSLDPFEPEDDCAYVIGTPSVQKYKLIEVLKKRYSLTISPLIHPTVYFGSNVHIGEGVTIDGASIIAVNAYLDDFCCINKRSHIGHDAKIGRYAMISAEVIVGGLSVIGQNCAVQLRATIFGRLVIGDWAVIGGGSVVTKDIPRGVVAYGVPSKIIRENDEIDFERYKGKRFIHNTSETDDIRGHS